MSRFRRSTALKVGCFAILMASVLRYFFASNWYSLDALILIDVIAASAFGMIQPLLGIYPAETVDKHRAEAAFRVRRIVVTVGRIAGPLLAGIVITVSSLEVSLLFVSAQRNQYCGETHLLDIFLYYIQLYFQHCILEIYLLHCWQDDMDMGSRHNFSRHTEMWDTYPPKNTNSTNSR
nr:hypothetical protein [uncultured Pseudomonas sp.]